MALVLREVIQSFVAEKSLVWVMEMLENENVPPRMLGKTPTTQPVTADC
jgi:hypothetical protein